jgi:tetratricopeptide (TPR) repeat protein
MKILCKYAARALVFAALSAALLAQPARAQSTEDLMNAGNEMLQRGAFDQAVSHFRKVTSREPRNFEAQYNLAFAYLGWGRYSNAVEEFKKALGLQPGSSHAWANIAVAYENMGKPGEALDALSKAVKADPNNMTARVNLASMYANNNKLNQAINEYMSLVKSGYTQAEVLVNLAKCLITAKRIDEAKKYFQEAIATDPNNVEARWELAHIFWKNEKNPDRALQELKLATGARPDVASLYEGIAGILEEQGKKKEAAEQLKKAIIYTNDTLVKERLQKWIDNLEGRTTGAATGSGTSLGGMQTLKREEDTKPHQTKQVKGPAVKVDMGDLLDDDAGSNKDPFGDIGKKK